MRIGSRRISKKLLLIIVPVVVLMVGAGAAFAAGTFSDISGHWAEQSIMNLANRGVIQGHDDGTFGPNEPVTRAQVATFLDRFNSKIGCTDCHVEGTLIVQRDEQFEESLHGSGEAWEEETRAQCAGCHGSQEPEKRIDAGLLPHDASVKANANPAPMNCRTCHDIHTTYTGADWTLTGDEKAVKMEYTAGTFDKGAGNLCANCHQVRNAKPAVTNGQITITSFRFGTHYGTESGIMLGEGGLGVTGSPGVHYSIVADSCVTCHMGSGTNHTMEPVVSRCTSCHSGLTNFDYKGVQTDVKAMLAEAKALLIANGVMRGDDEYAKEGVYSEAVANAFWNYKMVSYDGSFGVHNSTYTKALLQYIIDTLK